MKLLIGGLMLQTMHSFWDFNVGNLLTWIVVAVAWLWSRAQDWHNARQRIELLEKWQERHEQEADARDKLIMQMELATVKLTALVDLAEKRLNRLEEGGFSERRH